MTESYRPVQSLFAAATGAVAAPLGAKTGFLGNGLLGGTVGYTNTEFNNFIYHENKDSAEAAKLGFMFSLGGYATTKLLSTPLKSNVPILLQNRDNSNAEKIGGIISNLPAFKELSDK